MNTLKSLVVLVILLIYPSKKFIWHIWSALSLQVICIQMGKSSAVRFYIESSIILYYIILNASDSDTDSGNNNDTGSGNGNDTDSGNGNDTDSGRICWRRCTGSRADDISPLCPAERNKIVTTFGGCIIVNW